MECINPRFLVARDMSVPCGKCAFCLATRRSDWCSRISYERKLHYDSAFITLTYADWKLPMRNGIPQLSKPSKKGNSHLQLWFKKVRKAGYQFRYFAVGEYGSQTLRPHYHVLVFGFIPEDVVRRCWDKGIVHIGRVSTSSVLYCLKYVVNASARIMREGRVKPFAVMSRRPGLGANYLSDGIVKWHKSDLRNYMIIDGEKRHLPRFYRDKIFNARERSRVAFRAAHETTERLRKWYAKCTVKVSKAYPYGAISYREAALHAAAKRILSKSKEKLTI